MGSRVRRALPWCVAFCGGIAIALTAAALWWPQRPPPVEPADPALREEVATLQQLQAVDRQAQSVLRQRLALLTAQNSELNRRLLLLQRVLVPDGQPASLGIADLHLAAREVRQRVGYRMLLARATAARDPGRLAGRIELWSGGRQQGQAQQLRLAKLPLSLQRVQHVTGTLMLPVGFSPETLRVVVSPRGQAPMVFEYAWQELTDVDVSAPSATLAP